MGEPSTVQRNHFWAVCLYWLLIPGLVIGTGVGVDAVFGWTRLRSHLFLTVGAWVLVLAGAALVGRATRDLRVYGQGSPNPLDPPLRLTEKGSYAFCRHPMFLGYDLSALGVLLLVGSFGALLFSFPAFLAGEIWFLLQREEPSLQRRFPAEFPRYRARVPLLVPRIPCGKDGP